MRLIDTHCHLNFEEAFPNPAEALSRARQNHVVACLVVGCDLETSRRAVELAEQHEEVFAVVGFHPNYAASFTPDCLQEVRRMAERPKTVAIGEVGLDYHWDYATPEQQKACTLAHLILAADLDMPVVFHCREAWDDLLAWLETDAPRPARPIFHCFSGNAQHARRALALGGYLGVDGPVTYKKADDQRTILAQAPQDRLLLETDSPYLTPHPFRGKPNEPALLPLIARGLADAIGSSMEKVAERTYANALAAFPKLESCVSAAGGG
jgi:TatD DNase family protein